MASLNTETEGVGVLQRKLLLTSHAAFMAGFYLQAPHVIALAESRLPYSLHFTALASALWQTNTALHKKSRPATIPQERTNVGCGFQLNMSLENGFLDPMPAASHRQTAYTQEFTLPPADKTHLANGARQLDEEDEWFPQHAVHPEEPRHRGLDTSTAYAQDTNE